MYYLSIASMNDTEANNPTEGPSVEANNEIDALNPDAEIFVPPVNRLPPVARFPQLSGNIGNPKLTKKTLKMNSYRPLLTPLKLL